MSNKTGGLGDNFYIGGYDLSGDVASLDQVQTPVATFDVTSIKSFGNERIYGLRDGNLAFTSYWDFSGAVSTPSVPLTTVPYVSTYNFPVIVTVTGGTGTNVSINGVLQGTFDGSYLLPAFGTIILTYSGAPTWAWTAVGAEHDILSTLPRTDTIGTYARGTTLLNPAFCINGKQLNYDVTRGNAGDLTLKVQVQGNAFGGEWGKQVTAGLRTDITGTTGAAVDLGAGSTNGAQAYFQLTAFAGTNVTIKVRHCTTSGGTYADLISSGALTAVGSVRVTAAGTVNEFLKIVTSGTFTYATFNVVFVQNAVAVSF